MRPDAWLQNGITMLMKPIANKPMPRLALICALTALCAAFPAQAEPTNNATNQASSSATNALLPEAKKVVARFVKELGGEDAFAKINSQHVNGKCDMGAQGITGELEVFAKRPDKLVIKITLPGVGDLLQGFDGKVGWSMNPITGPMVLEGKMLEQIREQARFDSVLHDASDFKSMQTVGKNPFEGKDCYKLKLVRKSGQETIEYYDAQKGLLTGSTEVQETPLGAITVTAVISEYKKFGDLLFATRLTQKMGPLAQVMSFEKMEFNTVPDRAFDLPEQIKALLRK
jgi:hypothetical protein